MTADAERAERLRAAIESMPPGPSRTRFSELAASLGTPAPAAVVTPAAAPVPVPARRLLPLDDDVLPDEDVLPAGGDEVPIGQWQTWAPPVRRTVEEEPPANHEDADHEDADEDAAEDADDVTGDDAGEEEPVSSRPPLRIPASRPSPANEIVPPPKRQRRWRRHRSP